MLRAESSRACWWVWELVGRCTGFWRAGSMREWVWELSPLSLSLGSLSGCGERGATTWFWCIMVWEVAALYHCSAGIYSSSQIIPHLVSYSSSPSALLSGAHLAINTLPAHSLTFPAWQSDIWSSSTLSAVLQQPAPFWNAADREHIRYRAILLAVSRQQIQCNLFEIPFNDLN